MHTHARIQRALDYLGALSDKQPAVQIRVEPGRAHTIAQLGIGHAGIYAQAWIVSIFQTNDGH